MPSSDIPSIDLTARDKAALDTALAALNEQAKKCDTPALGRVLAVAALEISHAVMGAKEDEPAG